LIEISTQKGEDKRGRKKDSKKKKKRKGSSTKKTETLFNCSDRKRVTGKKRSKG